MGGLRCAILEDLIVVKVIEQWGWKDQKRIKKKKI